MVAFSLAMARSRCGQNLCVVAPNGSLLAAALAVCPLTLTVAGPATASTDTSNPFFGQCQTVGIPVALAPGDPDALQISGQYCVPLLPADTVDVLVPGTTYDSSYWNSPVDFSFYNYVQYTLLAGRATLAIDRLGTGASSHPPSSEITDTVSAFAVHQVIQWARQHLGYTQVDLIGHSLGSIIAPWWPAHTQTTSLGWCLPAI